MQLIQIFLPLFDNNKQGFPVFVYDDLEIQLKEKFGGVTFYRQTAAEGLWKDETGRTNFDEMIIAEVMVEELDLTWWQEYKVELEHLFKQEEILIRVIDFRKI